MADQRFVEDPVERFRNVVGAVSGTVAAPGLSEGDLAGAMQGRTGDDATAALATQIASHSRLTREQALSAIAPTVDAAADGDKARLASQVAAGAVAPLAADVCLSDPVMLKSSGRVVFAAIEAVIVVIATVLLAVKAVSNDRAIGLAIVALLNSIGILVLVMGYKNVTIKAAPPSP